MDYCKKWGGVYECVCPKSDLSQCYPARALAGLRGEVEDGYDIVAAANAIVMLLDKVQSIRVWARNRREEIEDTVPAGARRDEMLRMIDEVLSLTDASFSDYVSGWRNP